MIKLITIISEIKQVGGGDLQKFISALNFYNGIIDKLNDLQDTYKKYQWDMEIDLIESEIVVQKEQL